MTSRKTRVFLLMTRETEDKAERESGNEVEVTFVRDVASSIRITPGFGKARIREL